MDIDLANFLDTVNHDLVMGLLGRAIADKGQADRELPARRGAGR